MSFSKNRYENEHVHIIFEEIYVFVYSAIDKIYIIYKQIRLPAVLDRADDRSFPCFLHVRRAEDIYNSDWRKRN